MTKTIGSSKINKKNLLIVNLHLWPDKSSCSAIMFHIAESFLHVFEKITVITSKPKRFNSNFTKFELEQIDDKTDLNIIRLPLLRENLNPFPRIINAFALGFASSFKILFGNYKVVIATSSPPILSAFIISIASRIKGLRFIYYCMDINPEIGILSGDFRNNILKKVLLSIDKFICRQANTIIVHSNSMKRTLQMRFRRRKLDIQIINSLSVPFESNKINVTVNKSLEKSLKIIYAGNIGRFQGLENIIFTFNYLKKYKDIELTFLGDGVEKFRLKKICEELKINIKFKDYVSYQVSKKIISEADLGLVSLIPNMYKYAYPSKTMVYLEQGIPILALIEKESDLAKKILQNNIGFVCSINKHKSLANLLIKLYEDQSWKLGLKKACLQTFQSDFSDIVILKRWKKIIN